MTTFYLSIPIMTSLQSRVFGCSVFVHVHGPHRGKLDPRAIKCVFICYASNKKGYKCYHPQSCRVYVFKDVTFHETKSFFTSPLLQGENSLEVRSSSCHVFPCYRIPLPQRMTKILNQHHHKFNIRRKNALRTCTSEEKT